MSERNVTLLALLFLVVFFGGGQLYFDHFGKHVTITEQDEVRYCLNHLTDTPQDPKAIQFYCYELHGFELMDKGVKPNYDKFPKIW